MKPSARQAFLIGYLYGSSFEKDEKVEIWCRTPDIVTEISAFFEDSGIKYSLKFEDFRTLVVVDSYKEMQGLLLAFDIDITWFLSSETKRCPKWFEFCEIGDIDIGSAFFLGMFESAGMLEVSKDGEPSVWMQVSNLNDDMASQMYHFFRIYKEAKTGIEMDEGFFAAGKKEIGGVMYYSFHILPLLFKEIASNCSVVEWSKVKPRVS